MEYDQTLHLQEPGHHTMSGHYRPTSQTPFEWRFAGGPIVARFYMLTGKVHPYMTGQGL